MTRDEELNAGMYSGPKKDGSLTLQPFTLAIGQVLEEHGNRYAHGDNFKPKMSEVNELMFVMCHDIETVLAIPDDDWRKEVIRFAATLDTEQISKIEGHVDSELRKNQISEAKPRGKARAAKAG